MGNTIAFNGGAGIRFGQQINGNSIFANGGLGVAHGTGVTPNDEDESDNVQNYPVLSSVTLSGGNVRVTGSLHSLASTDYRIEIFANDDIDPSGFGEGQYYLGATNVKTYGNGNASFDLTFTAPPKATAASSTATGPMATSEFSSSILGQLVNISTRPDVQTGDNVMIGGFIVTGDLPKQVLLRGIGPSLAISGVPFAGRLMDPTLQVYDSAGTPLYFNDNWRDTQEAQIQATGLPPTDNRESAIVMTLPPAAYTAVMKGKDDTSGVGLVEVFDLALTQSKLANISTRGLVETGDNVMIAGFIIGPNGGGGARLLVRGLGPSLSNVSNPLQDPVIELRDSNGEILTANDDWRAEQAQVAATGAQPADDRESALVTDLPADSYTVILHGKGDDTGIGQVEVYRLQ